MEGVTIVEVEVEEEEVEEEGEGGEEEEEEGTTTKISTGIRETERSLLPLLLPPPPLLSPMSLLPLETSFKNYAQALYPVIWQPFETS